MPPLISGTSDRAFELTHGQVVPKPIRSTGPFAEGRLLRRFASACIDTSDGVPVACGELARLNRIGIEIEGETEIYLEPCARQIAVRAGLPAWTMLAGPQAVTCRIDTTRLRNIEFGGQKGFNRSVEEVLSCASPAVTS